MNYEPCIGLRGMLVDQQVDLSGLGGFFSGLCTSTSNAFEPPFNYRDTRRMLALDHNQPPFLTLALRCFFRVELEATPLLFEMYIHRFNCKRFQESLISKNLWLHVCSEVEPFLVG